MREYTQNPASGGKAKSIVLLLHGYGSNGQDLIGLAPYWAPGLPDTVFVGIDAVEPCEMGFGYQWFSLQSRMQADMQRGAEAAAPVLNRYIDDLLKKYDLTDDRLALVGFSQGTMMSLYVAPRRPKPLAGVLGYSGSLLGGEALAGAGIQKTPIHLVHGDADPVVAVGAWHHAMKTLQEAGFKVEGSVTPGLEHSIDDRGLTDGLAFLRRVLA